MATSIERELREFLATIGHPWSIDEHKKHKMVIIAGKAVGVICHGNHTGREKDAKQIIGAIKRRIRELETA